MYITLNPTHMCRNQPHGFPILSRVRLSSGLRDYEQSVKPTDHLHLWSVIVIKRAEFDRWPRNFNHWLCDARRSLKVYSRCGHWVSGPDNWILTSAAEVNRVQNLATDHDGTCFLSFLQTGSLLQALILRQLVPDCVAETLYVLQKYLLFISYIRERLAYKWHLSTYLSSNRHRRY